jgi:hypothetical protein
MCHCEVLFIWKFLSIKNNKSPPPQYSTSNDNQGHTVISLPSLITEFRYFYDWTKFYEIWYRFWRAWLLCLPINFKIEIIKSVLTNKATNCHKNQCIQIFHEITVLERVQIRTWRFKILIKQEGTLLILPIVTFVHKIFRRNINSQLWHNLNELLVLYTDELVYLISGAVHRWTCLSYFWCCTQMNLSILFLNCFLEKT